VTTRRRISRINADRLAAGQPIKMLRGRKGWHLPGTPAPALVDIHPALHLSEEAEGLRVVADAAPCWFSAHLIHIANEGGKGNAARIRTAKMRAQGQRPGVADYFLAVPVASASGGSGWPGLWLELKAACGRPSDEQEQFLLRMQGAGYACCFAYTADGAADAMATYLSGRWPR